jgi:hypothetical protein
MDKENGNATHEKPDAKVVIVTNLTRNVVESHLQIIFGLYGEITKIDLPIFGKCEWNLPSSFFQVRYLLTGIQRAKTEAKPPWNTLTRHRPTRLHYIWMGANSMELF